MSSINNQKNVKEQYASAGNLNTRISIHQKYSTNKMGFGNWIFSNYKITNGMKVLELGCGRPLDFMLLKTVKSAVSSNLPLHQTDIQKLAFTHLIRIAEKVMPMQPVFMV